MPKQVDHHQRRTVIADALVRVAAEQGPDAVSIRNVAATAGVSTGMVQHYFASKDELMLFALEVIAERVQRRVEAAPEAAASPVALLRTLLEQLLPLDETRRAEGRLGLAALAYAASHPVVAAVLRDSHNRLRDHIAGQLREASGTGVVPRRPESEPAGADARRLDPETAATILVALVDGLGQQVLTGAYPPETALAAFDAQLAGVFG